MNTFVALGGGDEVGASCYYLKLGQANILLDCGSRNGIRKYPYFDTLVENNILKSRDDLDLMLISHAHKDHYAAIPTVANIKDSRIISTPETKSQIYEMADILYKKGEFKSEDEKFSFKHLISSIIGFEYFEIINCKDVEIMFVPAGHIEGSAITILNYDGIKIVYTGDFSIPFTDNEMYNNLAIDLIRECDLLIMENTNGNDLNSKKLLSKHANFEQMIDFLGVVNPKKLFLVHQNQKDFYNYGFSDEVNKYYPTIQVEKVINKKIYNLGVWM